MDSESKPVTANAAGSAGARAAGFSLAALLVFGAVALAIVAPFVFLGNASGHDFEFHLASWVEVAHLWQEGVWYPRWAALANWGFGEPRFIFYPPASWMLGAALSWVLPWPMVPGGYIWLALTIAGLCMFRLASEWMSQRDAILAGVLFAANPYHLLLVYWRSDFAELLASAIFPLAVLYAVRAALGPGRAFVPLALVTAATWLMNAPAGVVFSYSLALLLTVAAIRERSPRVLLYGGGAMALGFSLAAFYIVPAAFEQGWVNLSEVLSLGLRPHENFLFTATQDPEHTVFNYLVSRIAVLEIGTTAIAIVFSARLRRSAPQVWWILLALAAAATALMFPISSLAWTWLPKLRYVQFPWRWLFPLGAAFAFFLATAMARARIRPLLWLLALAGLALTGFVLARGAWWDPGGVQEFRSNLLRHGYLGTDEYGPRGSDHYDLKQSAPKVAAVEVKMETASGQSLPPKIVAATIHIQHWGSEQKVFTVDSPEPAMLELRLLNYPAWRAEVNGKVVRARSAEPGQMMLPVSAEHSRVRVTFIRTRDRAWGIVLSLAAVVVLLVAIFARRRRAPAVVAPPVPEVG